MEVKFQKKPLHCLRPFLSKICTQEQTQEIRLPEGYPDIGRVLGCWGQPVFRSKEWRGSFAGATGGISAWVLYAPEDGTEPRVLDTWIPFQCRWDFPEPYEDGTLILSPSLVNLDGRNTSARKLILRAGVDTYGQAMGKWIEQLSVPENMPEDIQLLRRTYPVDLPVEAGEKQIQLDEILDVSAVQPPIQKIISYILSPHITEKKILTNRLVFHGQISLDMLYMSDDGAMHAWNSEIPFSQYTELDKDYENATQAVLVPVLTAAELDWNEEKQLVLQGGVAAQYTIFEREMVELVEDAFSPNREVTVFTEEMTLPVLLDTMELECTAEGKCPQDLEQLMDVTALADYPSFHQGENGGQIAFDGHFQLLYKNEDGRLMADQLPYSANQKLQTAPENMVSLWLGKPEDIQSVMDSEGTKVVARYPVMAQIFNQQPISVISQLELGEMREKDPNRPSLIIRKAGQEGLWNLAKRCGTTVAAIQEANQLTQEPEEETLLLIPVP